MDKTDSNFGFYQAAKYTWGFKKMEFHEVHTIELFFNQKHDKATVSRGANYAPFPPPPPPIITSTTFFTAFPPLHMMNLTTNPNLFALSSPINIAAMTRHHG